MQEKPMKMWRQNRACSLSDVSKQLLTRRKLQRLHRADHGLEGPQGAALRHHDLCSTPRTWICELLPNVSEDQRRKVMILTDCPQNRRDSGLQHNRDTRARGVRAKSGYPDVSVH